MGVSLIRRSFLKALVAAPVAAKAVATDALAKAGVSASVSGVERGFEVDPSYYGSVTAGGTQTSVAQQLSHIAKERMLRRLSAQSEGCKRGHRRNVSRLDPDLASHRSFSASALLRIQADRNIQRELEWADLYMEDWEIRLREEVGL